MAFETLEDHFQNKRLFVHSHMNEMLLFQMSIHDAAKRLRAVVNLFQKRI